MLPSNQSILPAAALLLSFSIHQPKLTYIRVQRNQDLHILEDRAFVDGLCPAAASHMQMLQTREHMPCQTLHYPLIE
jgi:hypothetical protein